MKDGYKDQTKALKDYKEELKPVFKSTASQFMTIIYSVDYKDTGKDAVKDIVTINKPDLYVLKLIKVVGDKTVTVKDMMAMLKLKGADNFRKKYLKSAIKNGYMTLLYPENVTNKGQAYYLTEKGLKLLAEL